MANICENHDPFKLKDLLKAKFRSPIQGGGGGEATSIADGIVTNAKVNATAAIVYSKLNLTGQIVNADLVGAIAQSKITDLTTDLASKASQADILALS